MKSHNQDYLESFVKTCMQHGLDEEATTMLLDNARHKDYLENSPEYREGFQKTIFAENNSNVKNATSLIRLIGRGIGALGRAGQSGAEALAKGLGTAGTKATTVAKKPGFLSGALVPVLGYGAYSGGSSLYNTAREQLNEKLQRFGLGQALRAGAMPDLGEFGVSAGTNKGRFGDALHAMQAADARLVGGDLRPFLSNASSKGPAILPSLRQKYGEIEKLLKQPVTDPSGYAVIPDLIKQRDALKSQIDKATRYSETAQPIVAAQTQELKDLYGKVMQGKADAGTMKRYEELSKRVPAMTGFSQQLGE